MEHVDIARLEDCAYAWLKVDREKCIRCGTCVDMCPMDVLRFGRSGYPYMLYRDDCWYCEVCTFLCPRQAITMTELPYLIS